MSMSLSATTRQPKCDQLKRKVTAQPEQLNVRRAWSREGSRLGSCQVWVPSRMRVQQQADLMPMG
eukprot:515736-Alexandrium_andersonii.AAC.1